MHPPNLLALTWLDIAHSTRPAPSPSPLLPSLAPSFPLPPRLIMTTDSERGTVAFKLREPGFLRNYEVHTCVYVWVWVCVRVGRA